MTCNFLEIYNDLSRFTKFVNPLDEKQRRIETPSNKLNIFKGLQRILVKFENITVFNFNTITTFLFNFILYNEYITAS